jgi:hypothetical protein
MREKRGGARRSAEVGPRRIPVFVPRTEIEFTFLLFSSNSVLLCYICGIYIFILLLIKKSDCIVFFYFMKNCIVEYR